MATGESNLAQRASTALNWLEARRWKVLAFTLPAVLLLHLIFATITIQRSNQDWRPSDQMAENYLAAAARNDPLPARTDGVRHPLWSWTVSHFYDDDRHVTFFIRGKWLNTTFCLMFLAALGIGVARWLDPIATVNLLLLSSLGIFIVRGTYFQPEPLFYIFLFLSGVLAFRILRGARWWHFALFGVTCGLAFLAKASLAPFLLAFAAAFALRTGLSWVRKDPSWKWLPNIGGGVLAGIIFAALLVPLALYTIEHYGKPLFSYTKYWMWMDDFRSEAYAFSRDYPGKQQLQTLTPEQIPGPAWYLRRHSMGDALERVSSGAMEITARFFIPEPRLVGQAFFWRTPGDGHWRHPLAHRGVYLIALAILCAVLAWPVRAAVWQRLRESGPMSILALILMTAALYIVLYGWYYPVGKGDRFMGSLWVPAVVCACWAAFSLRKVAGWKWSDATYLGIHVLILLSLLLQSACIAWLFSRGSFLATQN